MENYLELLPGDFAQDLTGKPFLGETYPSEFMTALGECRVEAFTDPFEFLQCTEEVLRVQESSQYNEVKCIQNSFTETKSSSNRNPKKPGRKPEVTGLTCRKDIALKALLRNIRRFHWEKLKIHTQFTTKRRQSKSECDAFLGEYIQKELGVEPNQKFISTLNLYLFSERPRPGEAKNLFREVLYTYSAAKLNNCLLNKYFRCLVYHYIFEMGPKISDSNSKIAIQMMEKKCNDCEI
ncbi:unnamed protein product [Moneuplotes crassus]|uniref:Uncharacterized protein n=1 Tax=Euplotes crassus TaxID=5936 RepID=A0AAD1U0F0_EUPCR|nr:unnamed protein product [Moneuplotes crassus]